MIRYFNDSLHPLEGFTLGKGYTMVPLRHPQISGYKHVTINDNGESVMLSSVYLLSFYDPKEENSND